MPDNETTTTEETTEEEGSASGGDGDELERIRDALKSANADAKKHRLAARAAKEELDKLRADGQSEAEKAIAKAKAEGGAEALQKANARVLRAEVKAIAAGKLADPADAVHFLDLSDFEVSEDGDVDSKAIARAIDHLVKEKPYLATGAKRTNGSADGGARGGGGAGTSMNDLIRQRMGR